MRPSCRPRFVRPESTFARIAFLVLLMGLVGMTACSFLLVLSFITTTPGIISLLSVPASACCFLFLCGAVLSLCADYLNR